MYRALQMAAFPAWIREQRHSASPFIEALGYAEGAVSSLPEAVECKKTCNLDRWRATT